MPYLSLVLPCHNVQAYLRQCLDSILDQSFTDIEVIAIDDASPDHSGDILDEYAARDDRLTVIHLTKNVGLGEGRNLGLEKATGEYVLFVDSDDWLAEGALEAIAGRLKEDSPDVLFFDYARTYWWGKVQRNVLNHLFREPPPPATFTLRERPEVIRIMMTAWNKAFRREFLLNLGQRFARGYYEDLPVTYPALMAAEKIGLLDRVCYYYRQRNTGAITRTPGRGHFAAFDQYDRVWEYMDRAGAAVEEFRPLMFERTFWHLFIIFARKDRVAKADRREFFKRMTETYRRYVPQGFTPPEGREGLKYRIVERGSYNAFQALKVLNLTMRSAKSKRRAVKKAARTSKRFVGQGVRRVEYKAFLREPLNENLAVFASYWYRAPACSPLAIYHALRHLAPHIDAVWVVRNSEKEKVPAGIRYVVDGSAEYYRTLAKATYLINNVNFPDWVVKRKGSIHIQTQHGTPLKTMGLDLQQYPTAAKDMVFPDLLARCARWDYNVSSNQHSSEVWGRAFPVPFTSLDYGYPRNDRFYQADANEVLKIRSELGIAPETTAILYAPTHREYRTKYESQLDIAHFARMLPDDVVLLVRAHYFYNDLRALQALEEEGMVIDVSRHPSTEDLCLAADVLLTDYSSIMFDYANLDRPVLIYADDYDTYRRVRGTYFDLMEKPPGAVATDEETLIEIVRTGAYDTPETRARLDAFRRTFCEWDDGHAAERVVRRVFLGEDPPRPIPIDQRTPAPAPKDLRVAPDASRQNKPAKAR